MKAHPFCAATALLSFLTTAASAGLAQDEKPQDYADKPLATWIEAMRNKDDGQARLEARRALGPDGPYAKVAVQALLDALGEKNPPVASDAAWTLAEFGPPVVTSLLRALKRPEAPVRAAVAEALGQVRPKQVEAVPALMEAIKDPSPDVRAAAARGIGNLGGIADKAVPASGKLGG